MAYIDVKKKNTKLSHLRSDHSYLYTTETDVGCEAVPNNDNLPQKAQFSQWTVSKTQGLGKKEKNLKDLVEICFSHWVFSNSDTKCKA